MPTAQANRNESRGGAEAAHPAHTRTVAGSSPAPATISGVLRPGDLLRSGRVRIAKFAATLEIWDGNRVAVILYPFAGTVKFEALPDRDEGAYPEFTHDAVSQALRHPGTQALPLVRTGQGDFARDLSEEDIR